jgi:NADH-quinone oxidoreductase subunit C
MESNLLSFVETKLKEKFAEKIISAEQLYDFPVFVINREAVHAVIEFLKEEKGLEFTFLTTMCGLHYPSQEGKELGVMYQLHNMQMNTRIRLKTFFPINDPHIPTVTDLYPTANWMERQEYDFFGILFDGHPNLKRILNVDDMVAFPMRKEFPLEDQTREDKDDKMFGR